MARRAREQTTSIGLYGKHPAAADFVRFNAASEALRAFDRWMSAALIANQRVAEGEWETLYAQSPYVSFLFHSDAGRSPRSLLGCFAPSHDRSGRLFPLTLFAEVELNSVAARYPALPYHRFMQQAEELLAGLDAPSHPPLDATVAALAPPVPDELHSAVQQHERYLDATDSREAFAAIFGASADDGSTAALSLLREVSSSLRPGTAPPRFGVRCPLGPAPIDHTALWLALLQRQSGSPLVPHALWTDRALVLYFGQLPDKALPALWMPQWQHDSICDLATAKPTEGQPTTLLSGQRLRGLLQ